MKPVLILDASPRVAVTIARSLHRHGVPADLASISDRHPRVRSNAIRSRFDLTSSQPESFLAGLKQLISAQQYDMLIPCTDEALVAVLPHYFELQRIIHVACPEPSVVERVLDKQQTVNAARQCGVPIPASYRFASAEELHVHEAALTFPMVAKIASKFAARSFPVRRFSSFEQLSAFARRNPTLLPLLMFQEYCSGTGVGVELLMKCGEPLAIFQHRRVREWPRSGGVSVLAEAVSPDSVLVEYAVRLLRTLGWNGVAMVEFRHDPVRGTLALMEVNGRYWGTLALSQLAGIEFPYYEWQIVHHQQPRIPAGYRTGIRMGWFTGDFLRVCGSCGSWLKGKMPLREVAGDIAGLARHLAPRTRDALWSLQDPLPAVQEFSGRALRSARRLSAVLPTTWRRRLQQSRALDKKHRREYWRLVLGRGFTADADRAGSLAHVSSLLFVCHGNIIRSPLAAALLQQRLTASARTGVGVQSAGLHASSGRPADPAAQLVAESCGVSLSHHKAVCLNRELVDSCEYIFVMDYKNLAEFRTQYPHARHKVFLLGTVGRASNESLEINDPYGEEIGHFEECARQIQARITNLAFRLLEAPVENRRGAELACVRTAPSESS